MTGETNLSQPGGEDARLQDLLRADAAAVIDDDLDDETDDEDPRRRVNEGESATAPVSQRPRSQVYSIRVPVERLEQVRRLARERGVAPTVMLRDWVLRQLDSEVSRTSGSSGSSGQEATPADREDERLDAALSRLERAIATLLDVVTQLTATLAASAASIATRHENVAGMAPVNRTIPLRTDFPAASASYTALIARMCERPWATALNINWLMPTDPSIQVTYQHVKRGVAALRSTVQDAANWPGVADHDLDTLYMAADEELSRS
jgi:hypothetical protein